MFAQDRFVMVVQFVLSIQDEIHATKSLKKRNFAFYQAAFYLTYA
jgi:hypothetical protein